jgi:hypothetical protein
LTWAQLQQNCTGFVVADASGTVPFGTSATTTKLIAPRVDLTIVLIGRADASASSSNVLDEANSPTASQQPARLTASVVDALLADQGTSHSSEATTHRLATEWFDANFVAHGNEDLPPTGLSALAVDQVAESISALRLSKAVLTAE